MNNRIQHQIKLDDASNRFSRNVEPLIIEEPNRSLNLSRASFYYNKEQTPQGRYINISLWIPDTMWIRILMALCVIIFLFGIVHIISTYPEMINEWLSKLFFAIVNR